MDLRDKPGKVQKCLELSCRFRLIFLVLTVIFSVTFLATGWQTMSSLPLGASEALGMWLADLGGESLNGAKYLGVAAIAMIVLFFVFGGIRSGIGGLVAALLFVGSLVLLDGSEGMQLVFLGVFAVVSLALLFFAKLSIACALFPFAIAWMLLTGFVGWYPLTPATPWLVWAVLSSVGFASVVAFALSAGGELASGAPQAGAIVKAGRKMLAPVAISSLLALAAITVDMGNAAGKEIAGAVILWILFVVWFFGFFFGTSAFAPWDRLRSGSRRVQMKDKKKKSKK